METEVNRKRRYIMIKQETWKELRKLGTSGDTMESVIMNLIEKYGQPCPTCGKLRP
jgi:hypothetical protein